MILKLSTITPQSTESSVDFQLSVNHLIQGVSRKYRPFQIQISHHFCINLTTLIARNMFKLGF